MNSRGSGYSGAYGSWRKQGLECKPVFEYGIIADDHRELLYWNVAHGDGDTDKQFDDCW